MGEVAKTKRVSGKIVDLPGDTEDWFQLAAQGAEIGLWYWDEGRQKLDWDLKTCQMFGVPPDGKITLQTFIDALHPDDRDRVMRHWRHCVENHVPYSTDMRTVRPDNTVRWIHGRGKGYYGKGGEPICMVGLAFDITERKRTEQELVRTNEQLRLALEAGAVGGWDWDIKSGTTHWFGNAHVQLGMSLQETSGSRQEFWDHVHEDDREHLRSAMAAAREEHRQFNEEFRVVWRDGSIHWLRSRGRYYYTTNGEPERMLGISIDITERKRAEETLFRYAAIVESSDEAISSVALDGVTTTWNAGAQRMFGYTESEAVGKHASMIVPPELRDQQKEILQILRAGGRIEQFETVRVTKTGKPIDVSLSIFPVKDSTGKTVGFAGIARDVTKRKQAEEALLSSEQRYRLLFERNVAGVGIGNVDGRLLDCNDGWARILGYQSRDEVVGRHALEFYYNPADRQPLLDELREQAVFCRELQLKRKDGSPVWVLFNAAALISEHNKPIVQTTMIDISESKRAEEALSGMTRKLVEAQEQERARIARELHDDVSQRLALLAVELDRWDHSSTDSPGLHSHLEHAKRCISAIAHDVQSLSHQLHSSNLEYLGLVAAARSFSREISEKNNISVDFREHGVPRSLPKEVSLSLFRILQQALHNAVQHSGAKNIEVRLWEDSNEVHLTVKDSGKGFDPLSAMQGGGLGLTSMRERARLVGGNITIDSKPMDGTSIHVRVPFHSEVDSQSAAV